MDAALVNEGLVLLDTDERTREWVSSLTGVHWKYTPERGWIRLATFGGVSEWRPFKPGVIWHGAVAAHSGETFSEVTA